MPSTDPFNHVDATIMEYDLVTSSIENQIDADGFVDLDVLSPYADTEPTQDVVMTAEQAEEHFDLYAAYIDEVAEIFVEADPQVGPQELDALRQKAADGEFGEIAQRFGVSDAPIDRDASTNVACLRTRTNARRTREPPMKAKIAIPVMIVLTP